MLQLPCLVFFIILWFSLELICKASMTTPEDRFFPLPTNLKIHLNPGIINVTWDCNITKSMKEHTYHIEFPKGNVDKINISKCFHEHFVTIHSDFGIHKGLQINISSGSESKVENTMPDGTRIRRSAQCKLQVGANKGLRTFRSLLCDGKNNTAAENLYCEVFNVSIINCSWAVGREAPQDAQYTLAFRQTQNPMQHSQQDMYVPCEEYRKDSFGRQIGCILKSPKIRFDKSAYVQLVGSSNETSIQFFDKYLKLDDFVILDPPRNIRLNYTSSELEITWDTPETYSNSDSHNFRYSVNISGNEHTVLAQSYKTRHFQLNERISVSVKVTWHYKETKWSRWSDLQIIDLNSHPQFTPIYLPLVSGIITFAILLLLIFLCHRFEAWKRLFPRIPKPAEKIFATVEQNELMEHNMTKKSLPEEDEECICLQVTEIPLKDQSHN